MEQDLTGLLSMHLGNILWLPETSQTRGTYRLRSISFLTFREFALLVQSIAPLPQLIRVCGRHGCWLSDELAKSVAVMRNLKHAIRSATTTNKPPDMD